MQTSGYLILCTSGVLGTVFLNLCQFGLHTIYRIFYILNYKYHQPNICFQVLFGVKVASVKCSIMEKQCENSV